MTTRVRFVRAIMGRTRHDIHRWWMPPRSMYKAKKISFARSFDLATGDRDCICCRLASNDAIGRFQPRIHRGLKRITPFSSERVYLPLTALDDVDTRDEIAAHLELVQHWIDRPLCGTATSFRRSLDSLNNFIPVHRLLMQHAQHEELRKRHLDRSLPIRPISVIGRLQWS